MEDKSVDHLGTTAFSVELPYDIVSVSRRQVNHRAHIPSFSGVLPLRSFLLPSLMSLPSPPSSRAHSLSLSSQIFSRSLIFRVSQTFRTPPLSASYGAGPSVTLLGLGWADPVNRPTVPASPLIPASELMSVGTLEIATVRERARPRWLGEDSHAWRTTTKWLYSRQMR